MIKTEKFNLAINYIKGTSDNWELIDNYYLTTENKSLNYFGIAFIDTEEDKIYNVLFYENISEIYPETNNMTITEKYNYFMNLIDEPLDTYYITLNEVEKIMRYQTIKEYIKEGEPQ